jgi:hypothetical protein
MFQAVLSQLDGLKTSKVIVKFMEPLFGRGHALWMDGFCSSPHALFPSKEKRC